MKAKCACGRWMSKHSRSCNVCHAARMAEIKAGNSVHVLANRCPDCGAALRRNLSLTGWYECEQRGAVGFRKDASKPSCEFNCFV